MRPPVAVPAGEVETRVPPDDDVRIARNLGGRRRLLGPVGAGWPVRPRRTRS